MKGVSSFVVDVGDIFLTLIDLRGHPGLQHILVLVLVLVLIIAHAYVLDLELDDLLVEQVV